MEKEDQEEEKYVEDSEEEKVPDCSTFQLHQEEKSDKLAGFTMTSLKNKKENKNFVSTNDIPKSFAKRNDVINKTLLRSVKRYFLRMFKNINKRLYYRRITNVL